MVTTLAVILTLAWHYVWPASGTWLLLIAFVPLAIISKNIAAIHLAILAALSMAVPRLLPTYPSLFVSKGAVLAAYGALCLAVPALRRGVTWLRFGKIDRRTWLTAAIFLFGFALFTAWYLAHYRPPAPQSLVAGSGTSVILFIVLGAAVNALSEEVFWRGTMQTALESIGASATLALLVQAAHFGLAHYRGPFFAGWAGVFGAALMGVVMGSFRQRTGSILLSWLLHFLCDAVLFVLSAYLLARPGA